mmetsp:Transcript_6275/g.11158  ORF Transcript_6275/g.11158 Transcript_6275/m.11158 type:complete len:492 (-) Transcript_6275:100-1575(-)|eukprot:CAMPEP_0198283104 /NCGR_PEP_ID=MMETSP1449-20131203/2783_1 /TAXON_ID=420275 /ORGANISM="Attheya septentrionalis, Strain CCMP2084" /LENGTH=491 /DNA_ID=CAMNT_0043979603 /DNA_START=277 /DNA_END=1752 /DNA_ORIENTATION=-
MPPPSRAKRIARSTSTESKPRTTAGRGSFGRSRVSRNNNADLRKKRSRHSSEGDEETLSAGEDDSQGNAFDGEDVASSSSEIKASRKGEVSSELSPSSMFHDTDDFGVKLKRKRNKVERFVSIEPKVDPNDNAAGSSSSRRAVARVNAKSEAGDNSDEQSERQKDGRRSINNKPPKGVKKPRIKKPKPGRVKAVKDPLKDGVEEIREIKKAKKRANGDGGGRKKNGTGHVKPPQDAPLKKRKKVPKPLADAHPTLKKSKKSSITPNKDDSRVSSSDESDSDLDHEEVKRSFVGAPKAGEKIAIKCPADPPYPSGWYSAAVVNVEWHKGGSGNGNNMNGWSYTARVEWDGGEIEDVVNPNWRVLGQEPDKKGHKSQRDAKLRPFLHHWVKRLRCMEKAEEMQRARQNRRHAAKPIPSASEQMEWVQCANPGCGKWRSLPRFLPSRIVMEKCNKTWYCVLNYWDDSMASCAAPQECGYVDELLQKGVNGRCPL